MIYVEYNLPDRIMEKIKKLQEMGGFDDSEKEVIIRAVNNLYERSQSSLGESYSHEQEVEENTKIREDPWEKIDSMTFDETFQKIRKQLETIIGNLEEGEREYGTKQPNNPKSNTSYITKCSVPNTLELYKENNQDLIWFFVNRFWPIKVILHFLAKSEIKKSEDEKTRIIKEFEFETIYGGLTMDDFILELEEETKVFVEMLTQMKAFDPLLIGFPTTREKFLESPRIKKIRRRDKKLEKAIQLEKTSMNRFIAQFFGRILAKKDGKTTRIAGACFEMNLVEAYQRPDKTLHIRTTELGKQFRELDNPIFTILEKMILDGTRRTFEFNLENIFSDLEKKFILKKIISQFPLEHRIIQVYLEQKEMSVDSVYEIFKENQESYLGVKTDDDRVRLELGESKMRIQAGTIMKRLEELGFFKRIQIGKNVKYVRLPIK